MLSQPHGSLHHKHIEQVMHRRERKYPFLTGLDLSVQIMLLLGMLASVAYIGYLALDGYMPGLSNQVSWLARKLLG